MSDVSATHPREAVDLAQALIRQDTSNPPGNETRAAKALHEWLTRRGVSSQLVGGDPSRMGVIARVAGASGDTPTIALCGHLDVVPADPSGWTSPPFAAEIHDGWLIGRGACDMKSQVASYARVLAALASRSTPPAGDVLLIAVADEECSQEGASMRWVTEKYPELACDFALDEGGGDVIDVPTGGRRLTVSTGEKASTVIRITASTAGGHGSHTSSSENALSVIASSVSLLESYAPTSLMIIGSEEGSTLNPTRVRAAHGNENVAPGNASVDLDTRIAPGDSVASLVASVRQLLSHLPVTLEELYDSPLGGSSSPVFSPLMDALQVATTELLPGTELSPMAFPGFTNAHFLRANWGTTTYGCWPRPNTGHTTFWEGVHATNERLHVSDIELATNWTLGVVDALGQ